MAFLFLIILLMPNVYSSGWSQMLDEPPTIYENKYEEKDVGGVSSSGYGLGWYVLLGFQFHFSRSISLIIKTQINFGSVELNMKNGNFTKELAFTNGTIEIATSYKF